MMLLRLSDSSSRLRLTSGLWMALSLPCGSAVLAEPTDLKKPVVLNEPVAAPATAEPGASPIAPPVPMPFQKVPETAPRTILAQNTPVENNTGNLNQPNGAEQGPTTTQSGTLPAAPARPGTPDPGVPNNLGPGLNGGNTTGPSDTPANPAPGTNTPADGATGATGDEGPNAKFSLESPNGFIYNGERGTYASQGPVTFRYGQFTVRSDRAVYDEKSKRAVLTGNLTVTVRGRTFQGKTIVFDTNTGRWTLSNVERVFSPIEFPYGTVLEPIFVRGAGVSGNYDQVTREIGSVQGSSFNFTSCERDHYFIMSKRLDFYRDAQGEPDRIVLHRNALYVFGRKIIPLPPYVINLQSQLSRRNTLQPTVGQNPIDGFFVRTLYNLSANARRTDSLLVDALQKRGAGIGFARELAGGAGLFYLYGLTGKTGTAGRQIDARIRRFWQISPTLNSIINFQSTQNSFLGVGSARNGDFALNRTTERMQTALLTRFSNNSNGFTNFQDMGVTLDHTHDFGGGFQLDANTIYSTSQSTGVPDTSNLDNLYTLTRRSRLLDALLRTELHDDLTGRSQIRGAYQLERVPEFVLQTTPERLKLPFFQRFLPGDVALGIGSYNEPASTQRLSRTDFNYTANPRPITVAEFAGLRTSLNTFGRFGQAFYSNDTARYNYNYSFELVTGSKRATGIGNLINPITGPIQGNPLFNSIDPSPADTSLDAPLNAQGRLSARLNYYKQRMVGFTPFQFDFLSPTESIAGTTTLAPTRWLSFNVSAGRDLQNNFSNDIIAGMQFRPSRSVYASLSANYSPETHLFGDIIGRLHLRRNPRRVFGGAIEIDVRYSSPQGQITQANAVADILLTRSTRLQAITGYNGFTKEFDLAQFRIVQDLHCFNLYAFYDNQRREFRLDLAIKAFPFLDTRIGMDRQGAGFDPYIGGVR